MARAGFVTRFLKRCAVAAFLVFVAACGGGSGGGEPVRTVATVTVSSPTLTPKQGDTLQLSAVARDQFGEVMPGTTASWSSSAPSVATISSTGLLQALAGGSVTVTATIDNVPGSLTLTVTARVTTTVTVGSPTQALQVGETVQLTAVARDQFGDVVAGKTATWSTSDATIATVSAAGVVQAVAPGTVVATATIDGVPGAQTLTVSPRTVASVTISSPTSSPKEGDSVQLTATARDPFGNIVPGVTATWSVSDATVAAVSATGLLQTYATGTVQAKATVGGVSGMASLTVTAIKVAVTIGAKEVVYRYATDRCSDLDAPDQPPRMVRAEDGSLVLFAGNAPRIYVSRGADFGSLKRECQPVLVSADRTTPESYENQEWLWVVYRDGNRWHGFVHNEYHDPFASTCLVGDTGPANPCWYNSITHALSTDSARSFSKPSAPAHVVAPAPNVWTPPAPGTPLNAFKEGYFSPSNIIRAVDGFYYMILGANPSKEHPSVFGICPARTDNLDDPASWRAWDGTAYNLRMTSPYVTGSSAAACTFLDNMGPGNASLTYNSYLGRYMRFGNNGPGTGPCGFYFTLSADLIHWSGSQLAVDVNMYGCASQAPAPLEPVNVLFPAIVDHTDTTINFERAGRTAFLYYVRYNRGVDDPLYWLDRDVVRVPITFTRID